MIPITQEIIDESAKKQYSKSMQYQGGNTNVI